MNPLTKKRSFIHINCLEMYWTGIQLIAYYFYLTIISLMIIFVKNDIDAVSAVKYVCPTPCIARIHLIVQIPSCRPVLPVDP